MESLAFCSDAIPLLIPVMVAVCRNVISTNRALVTEKVGDSPDNCLRGCLLVRTLSPIKLTFLIAAN